MSKVRKLRNGWRLITLLKITVMITSKWAGKVKIKKSTLSRVPIKMWGIEKLSVVLRTLISTNTSFLIKVKTKAWTKAKRILESARNCITTNPFKAGKSLGLTTSPTILKCLKTPGILENTFPKNAQTSIRLRKTSNNLPNKVTPLLWTGTTTLLV